MANIDIKYLNKDFSSFKEALIEYAKAYYPATYNDFTTASPGTMFIDMASYVGDVMSFYLDNQLQETFLEFAKQQSNLYAMAYMLGYRPRVTSAAVVPLDVYQQLPATTVNGQRIPDFSYALTIEEGMQVQSSVNSTSYFYVPDKIDFNTSSSMDPTEINVYSTDQSSGQPTRYLLKKTVQALSGQVKSKSFSFGPSQRFSTVTIQDTNIIEITKATDSATGDTWYEVPYLAQNYILKPVANTAQAYPLLNQDSNQVPFVAEKVVVNKRFTSRFKSAGTLEIEFGAGVNQVSSSLLIPDPFNVGIGTINGQTLLNTAFDPTNFVTTEDYGIAPSNTTITIEYLTGGGASANAKVNELTKISIANTSFKTPILSPALSADIQASLVVGNSTPATGGGDGDSIEDIRLNTLAQYPSQLRAVTQRDYLGTVLSMPAKFGKIAKAYVSKDDVLFNKYQMNEPGERDPLATSLYILTYNSSKQYDYPSPSLFKNIQTYLNDFRMLTDSIHLKPAYIVNIGVDFDIVMRPNYSTRETISTCLTRLKAYFDRDRWQINQPIILSEIYTLLDQVQGVQTVQAVRITNLNGESNGYSKYSYDIPGATLKGVIYPSLDPSIFEVKYPDTNIQGRVVTF